MIEVTYSHKGWFGICPVYVGNLSSNSPNVDERHWLLIPLMFFSEFFFDICFAVKTWMDPDYEPEWPITHLEPLDEPKVMHFQDPSDEDLL